MVTFDVQLKAIHDDNNTELNRYYMVCTYRVNIAATKTANKDQVGLALISKKSKNGTSKVCRRSDPM